MASNEDLLLEVERIFFSLEIEQLMAIADELKVPQKEVSGKTRFNIIKLLSSVLEDHKC